MVEVLRGHQKGAALAKALLEEALVMAAQLEALAEAQLSPHVEEELADALQEA